MIAVLCVVSLLALIAIGVVAQDVVYYFRGYESLTGDFVAKHARRPVRVRMKIRLPVRVVHESKGSGRG